MAELDPDGLPVLPEGMWWRLKVSGLRVGIVEIRQQRKWWFSKRVFSHYYFIADSGPMQQVAGHCFRLWHKELVAEADIARAHREAGDYGKR